MQRSAYVNGVPSPSEPLRDYMLKQQQFKTCFPTDGLYVPAHQNLGALAAKSGAGDESLVKHTLQQQITSSAYSVDQEEMEQLKEEIENIRVYLDRLSQKLELCSLSQTTLVDENKSTRVASPKSDYRQATTIRFDKSSCNRSSSKKYDESVYFGFANDERIAKPRPQKFYDCVLPMKITAQEVQAAQSVQLEVHLPAAIVAEKEVKPKAEKNHKSVDASVYHAKELFNNYYA